MPTNEFEYFCGANIVIEVDGCPLYEACAIQYNVQESKVPIYGYSSRHFDGVASGQVIVNGSIGINFVHQNYLYECIRARQPTSNLDAYGNYGGDPTTQQQTEIANALLTADTNPQAALDASAFAKQQIWGTNLTSGFTNPLNVGKNPFDQRDPVDIKITFGERSSANRYNGRANLYLADVFFTGRGSSIQIDENTIIEMYNFFARDVYSLTAPVAPPVIITSSADVRNVQGTEVGGS